MRDPEKDFLKKDISAGKNFGGKRVTGVAGSQRRETTKKDIYPGGRKKDWMIGSHNKNDRI